MTYINRETTLELIIDEELVQRIAGYGTKKYPNEFGGLLLGRYSNNNKTVVIEDTLLPKKYQSSRYSFERGPEGVKESLEQHYKATPSLIYVGEWHTHPDSSAIPSLTDLKAMNELANDTNVLIDNPVLMIFEIKKHKYNMELYLLYKAHLLRYIQKEP